MPEVNAEPNRADHLGFDESEQAELVRVNAIDYELFAFAKQLAAKLTAAAMARAP